MLSPKQLRAAELLLEGVSGEIIALELSVSLRTVQRWQRDEEFKQWMAGISYQKPVENVTVLSSHKARRERLEALMDRAISTVEEVLENPEARTCDRLKAAQMIGDWSGAGKLPDYEAAIMALQELGWLPSKVLEASMEGSQEFRERIREALQSGQTKTLS